MLCSPSQQERLASCLPVACLGGSTGELNLCPTKTCCANAVSLSLHGLAALGALSRVLILWRPQASFCSDARRIMLGTLNRDSILLCSLSRHLLFHPPALVLEFWDCRHVPPHPSCYWWVAAFEKDYSVSWLHFIVDLMTFNGRIVTRSKRPGFLSAAVCLSSPI